MRTIIINDDQLKDEDVERCVERVKGVLLTTNGKILLAYNNHTYQFLGGHVEEGEDKKKSLIREIKEEAGIDVEIKEDAFLNIITYDNNYFDSGQKVKNSIFYYKIISDDVPDYSNTHYDELEVASEFNLLYINFVDLEEFIKKNISLGEINENIGREMLYALETYKSEYGGNI